MLKVQISSPGQRETSLESISCYFEWGLRRLGCVISWKSPSFLTSIMRKPHQLELTKMNTPHASIGPSVHAQLHPTANATSSFFSYTHLTGALPWVRRWVLRWTVLVALRDVRSSLVACARPPWSTLPLAGEPQVCA